MNMNEEFGLFWYLYYLFNLFRNILYTFANLHNIKFLVAFACTYLHI